MAFIDPDSSLEALDPLERSLVEDVREIAKDITVEFCRKLFYHSWNLIFIQTWFKAVHKPKRCCLDGIQRVIEMSKYIKGKLDNKTEDDEGTPLLRGFFDPTSEDFVFWTNWMSRLVESQANLQIAGVDDIPLD